MAYVVGQAEVLVLPNARRFQEELGRQIAPTARRVGQDVGDELSRQSAQGLAKGLAEGGRTAGAQGEQAGGSFASGFQKRLKAALQSLPDANVRLNVTDTAQLDRLRAELTALSKQRIGIDISAEEAEARVRVLQAQLTELGGRSSHVQLRVDTAAASAELAKFKVEMAAAGDDGGSILSEGMRQAAVRHSPLVAAAIAGGLIAGAPAVLAASTLLFGGIAAAAVHSQRQVYDQAQETAQEFTGVFQQAAQQTVPAFVTALQRIGTASLALRPQLDTLFGALNDPIDQLTTGLINLMHNAMPGLVAATQAATPVFQGLSSLLGSIGTGISNFMSVIAQHGPAAGQVFASLGTIVQNLLPALGELVGAGVELASQVLPPLASALGVVNSVLHAIAPELPIILAAFLGFKAVSLLDGPLTSLAARLENLGGVGARAGSVVSGLAGSLPVLGLAVAAGAAIFETAKKQVDDWATALNAGGAAADRARVAMQQQNDTVTVLNSGLQGGLAHVLGYGTGLDIVAGQSGRATQAARDQIAAMTPLEKAQQAVTTAQNEYLAAVDRWGPSSGQAVAASQVYRDAQDALKQKQDALNLATNGVNASAQENTLRLQGLAGAASQADSAIGLLKSALDALTGTAITADQAQIAVTQATEAAKHALDGQRDAAGNLTSALTDTNGSLNLNTAAGAAAAASLINLSGTMHQQIATLEQQGASTADVSAKTDQLRQDFINQAKQMGLNDQAAQDLANRYFGMPDQVHTEITADTGPARAQLSQLVNDYSQSPINLGISIRTGRQAAASGGYITGPGGPTSDDIPAMLSNGEFVINAASTAQYRPLLEAINGGGQPTMVPGFASGGLVDFMRWMEVPAQVSPSALSAARAQMTQLNSAASFSGGTSSGVGLAGNINRALGLTIASQMGYGAQFPAIDYIASHESGWRNTAQNPTSTAYGIFQFLNSTWGAYGGKTSDPATQIRDGIRYMVDRYGSPNAAANFWKSHHWYHDGGVVQGPAGANVPAILQAGETVRTASQEAALHGGGALTLQLDGPATVDLLEGRAVSVAIGALTTATNRRAYNG